MELLSSSCCLFQTEHDRLAAETGTLVYTAAPTTVVGTTGGGTCPPGTLTIRQLSQRPCPGFQPPCGTLELTYKVPDGTTQSSQSSQHHPTNPGRQPFFGTTRVAFLPDNPQGRQLLTRYQVVWLQGKSLEIGYSVALKRDHQVKWRDQVPHKTSLSSGGAFGFPDATFLAKAHAALDRLGIPDARACLALLPHAARPSPLPVALLPHPPAPAATSLPPPPPTAPVDIAPVAFAALPPPMAPPTAAPMAFAKPITGDDPWRGSYVAPPPMATAWDPSSKASSVAPAAAAAAAATISMAPAVGIPLEDDFDDDKVAAIPLRTPAPPMISSSNIFNNTLPPSGPQLSPQAASITRMAPPVISGETIVYKAPAKITTTPQGKCPSGKMTIALKSDICPGFHDQTISISYVIPSGKQAAYHDHPKKPFEGTQREAFLPDNNDGRALLIRLKYAWMHGLTFNIGTSPTTGRPNQTIWNAAIPHKTIASQCDWTHAVLPRSHEAYATEFK